MRCSRCDRPICPECMVAASVGFQCPDDVAAGARDARPARTAYGGRLSPSTSAVTTVLVGLNVVVYLLQLADPGLTSRFGNYPLGVADGQVERLLTAAFLHAGLFHLLSNMFALVVVGPQLEAALGRTRYLALYVLSALGGSVLSYVLSPPGTLGVGASGAVFGLFGAFYVVVRRLGGDTRSIAALLVINLVITFSVRVIDWRAHVGGLVVGAVVALVMVGAPRGARRGLVQGAGCAAVALLLVAGVLLRTAALRA